jgi:hypothetical protein
MKVASLALGFGVVAVAVAVAVQGFLVAPPSPQARGRGAAAARGSAVSRLHMDLDQNTITGIAAGVGGLVLGIGLVAFTEQQGERTSERGLDESVANKLQAKLLEDFAMEESDVGSVTQRMRTALREQMTDEEKAAMAVKKANLKREKDDDGWGDD